MKPRSKRNRKRPRGGIGCLVGDGENSDHDVNSKSPSSLLRVEVVPLSRAFGIISDITRKDPRHETANATQDVNGDQRQQIRNRKRVRIIRPYPFTFATFAKARWIGRTVVDIYHEEFGSYPRSYYEAAIKAGRILVSGGKVGCEYKVKGGDELTHTVHRHEPAVGLSDMTDNGSPSDDQPNTIPPVQIVHEDNSLLIVDKPATLPIHPCGGYNFNSLFEILSHWKEELYGSGKLFTVHRLDRLTSGLVLIAKSSALARSLGKCIMERDGCEKIYLARVKGRFPLNVQKMDGIEDGDGSNSWEFQYSPQTRESNDEGLEEINPNKRLKYSVLPPCQYGQVDESNSNSWRGGLRISVINSENKKKNHDNQSKDAKSESKIQAGLGYWIADGCGTVVENAKVQDLVDQCENVSIEEMLARAIGTTPMAGSEFVPPEKSTHWLHFSCPCRISSHKNGICEAGSFSDLNDENERKGIKPAQTSFTLLSYDATSDTSLVVAKPVTGRTHQIRLHLQKLGHPIANDHCYGGDLWYGDREGKEVSEKSREWLDRLDRGAASTDKDKSDATDANNKNRITPENSTNADTPATDAEIYHAAANRPRDIGESIEDFIEKTCVWCARCRGVDNLVRPSNSIESKLDNEKAVFQRTLMEYLVRNQGIWLHALQYSLKMEDESGHKILSYRTNLPSWAELTEST